MNPSIALLGLGAMGSRMARRWLQAGFPLTVYNRTPAAAAPLVAAGATFATTPRAAAAQADFVVAMVTDDDVSRAIWSDPADGALLGLRPGAVAIESSTLTPNWVSLLAAAVAARGAHLIDAPVVGSRPHAESGQLIQLVGGDPAVVERARAVLAILGPTLHHLGPVGHGATLKLAVNALFAIQAATFGELLGLTAKSGLDPSAVVAALSSLPTTSPVGANLLKAMLARNYAPQAPVAIIEKDLRYALTAAREIGPALPTTATVHAQFTAAQTRGWGADNITGIARLFD